MDVGLQAGLFEFGDKLGGQLVVEVLGHMLASNFALGPPGGGVVSRRRRVTCLMRATSSWAASLSATF